MGNREFKNGSNIFCVCANGRMELGFTAMENVPEDEVWEGNVRRPVWKVLSARNRLYKCKEMVTR
jgi:hypothetical protein